MIRWLSWGTFEVISMSLDEHFFNFTCHAFKVMKKKIFKEINRSKIIISNVDIQINEIHYISQIIIVKKNILFNS